MSSFGWKDDRERVEEALDQAEDSLVTVMRLSREDDEFHAAMEAWKAINNLDPEPDES